MQKPSTQTTGFDRKSKNRYTKWLVLIAGLIVTASIFVTITIIGAYYFVAPDLPPAETIRKIPLQIPLRIFSRDGRLIAEVGERRRIRRPLPLHARA